MKLNKKYKVLIESLRPITKKLASFYCVKIDGREDFKIVGDILNKIEGEVSCLLDAPSKEGWLRASPLNCEKFEYHSAFYYATPKKYRDESSEKEVGIWA